MAATIKHMPEIDFLSATVIVFALALGGTIKGATGAGAPVVAVPVIAAFFDVRIAVIIMATPNFLTNIRQLWKYWPHRLHNGFDVRFAVSGAAGAILGTLFLANFPISILTLGVAITVTAYVLLRVLHSEFRISQSRAWRLAFPAGLTAGILQGAAGISAPVSVSFLNAIRLERPTFIATISAFFIAMSLVQLPTLALTGLMTAELFALSLLAVLPILAFMPFGAWLANKLSAEGFDRLVLVMLSILAIRLLYVALF
ncbi:MAG: sulfite exporter TauE/SafE family protein [Boseongicola sp.]